jgi:hypothetical protein
MDPMEKRVIELQALICEREGMIAENMQRQAIGASMAFTYDNFMILAEHMRRLQPDYTPQPMTLEEQKRG